MNDQPEITPAKPSRKRKTTAPRKPRVKDPGILAIEQEMAAKKALYRVAKASGRILKRITDNLLPRLTQEDAAKLAEVVNAVATPALLPGETPLRTSKEGY